MPPLPPSDIGDFVIGASPIEAALPQFPSNFPPTGPTSLLATIPSYLYQEYSDDDDLQAFVASYNALAQEYVNWFAAANLGDYTSEIVVGALLDWVAEGLYGMARPTLASGRAQYLGPFDTARFNALQFNGQKRIGSANYQVTSDDVFKRILTWHVYKGDGKVFDVRWLKRRVMRFLIGANGTAPNIDETYQISVTFGTGNQVNINILSGLRTVVGGARFDRFQFNARAALFNGLLTTFEQFAPLALAPIFKEAVDSGVLELPFQFTYVVNL
jgi:hypothetical protein